MLEYFTYKKVKKHRAEKEAQKASIEDAKDEARLASSTNDSNVASASSDGDSHRDLVATPILQDEDERFIEDLLAKDDEPVPPLPPRLNVADSDWPSDNESQTSVEYRETGKGKEAAQDQATDKKGKKPNRLSMFFTRAKKPDEGLKPNESAVTPGEAENEKYDLSRVLARLNLSAMNNKVVALSGESSELLSKFTQVFKDLANGVPTAYDDLSKLIEDRDGTISKGFDKLPSSMKKLVTQLPERITSSLGPELLATAAASQGLKAEASGSWKGTAKNVLLPHNISELVTKPGAIAGMLRAIVEALKARWPAFVGMNVLWSVALTLLLFVLWYCHKRGREVRIEREASGADTESSNRVEELPDDPALPAPETIMTSPESDQPKLSSVKPPGEPEPSRDMSQRD